MKCETCSEFEGILINEQIERKYDQCTKMADSLGKLGSLEIISGDCELHAASVELCTEKHFTVSHYLECQSCKVKLFALAAAFGVNRYLKLVSQYLGQWNMTRGFSGGILGLHLEQKQN